jgi:hypothetical protein
MKKEEIKLQAAGFRLKAGSIFSCENAKDKSSYMRQTSSHKPYKVFFLGFVTLVHNRRDFICAHLRIALLRVFASSRLRVFASSRENIGVS